MVSTNVARKTAAGKAETLERERQALELRKAGLTLDAIAKQMGLSGAPVVHGMVTRALDRIVTPVAEEYKKLELERLDALYRAMAPAALQGKWLAVDRCLAIMDRRAKLLGLDAPQKHAIEVVNVTIDDLDSYIASARAELEAKSKGLPAGKVIDVASD